MEAKLAALDRGEEALLLAQGMAGVTTTMLSLLKSGGHFIITDDYYRRTRQFCHALLTRFGVLSTVVPVWDMIALEDAIQPGT